MSKTLFNSNPFPVFIKELEKHLAPYESIVVKDAEVDARLATGILSTDLSGLKDLAKEDLAKVIATCQPQ
jgi:hypothetical protein